MWLIAAMRPLVALTASLDTAQEEINALPASKYVVPPSTPSNFPEDTLGIQSQTHFQSPTRVAESAVGVGMPSRLHSERGNDV
jgi:hypothetical protein